MSAINRDVWLAAIREIEDADITNDPTAVTLHEFAESLHKHRGTALKLMRKLIELGRAERTKKFFRRSDGVVITVPAYRLKESPNGAHTVGRGRSRDARRGRHHRPRA